MCFLIIGKKVCLNYTPWCAIVHTLVCTKTHLGVLFNTPVLRVYFPMSAELFCRRFALFRNLSPPTVDGDGGMRSQKHSSNNRITLLILSVLNKFQQDPVGKKASIQR